MTISWLKINKITQHTNYVKRANLKKKSNSIEQKLNACDMRLLRIFLLK